MVMGAYLKTVFRTVKNNMGRFIAITLIVALGISFVTGLGTLSYKMEASLDTVYERTGVADIIIKTESQRGFGAEDIETVKNSASVEAAESLTVIDGTEIDGKNARIYIAPIRKMQMRYLWKELPIRLPKQRLGKKSKFSAV